MESINYVILFYNDVDAGLINECTQFREYLQITNKEKQTKCSYDLTKSVSYDEVIREFANKKCRKQKI